jgi:hypothetical protein
VKKNSKNNRKEERNIYHLSGYLLCLGKLCAGLRSFSIGSFITEPAIMASTRSFFASIFSLHSSAKRQRKAEAARRLKSALKNSVLDLLEERQLLATYYVDNFSDANSGSGSNGTLRWAIGQANTNPGADTIEFYSLTWPRTITLTAANGPILINGANLTIDGSGQNNLTISGGNVTGIFEVQSRTDINNLSIVYGNGGGLPDGGAIYKIMPRT